jgi:hypothetical protein
MRARLPFCLMLAAAATTGPAAAQELVVGGEAREPTPLRGSAIPPRGGVSAREAVVIQRRCGSAPDPQAARPTGEVHGSASTAGEQQVGATVCVPLGKRGDVVLGGEAIKIDPSQAPRRPGWP